MVTISYSTIDPRSVGFINSKKFQRILEENPNLQLVTVEEDRPVFVGPKLAAGTDEVIAVIDKDDPGVFMWLLNDQVAWIENPSKPLIKMLKLMDKFNVLTEGERIFSTPRTVKDGLYSDAPEVLEAKFSFKTGEYKFK